MKFFQIILAWSSLAALPMTTALGYDGDTAPNPGSYWQGSSAGPRDSVSSSGYPGSNRTDDAYAGSGYWRGGDPGHSGYAPRDFSSPDYGGGSSTDTRSDWYSSDWYDDQIGDRWRGDSDPWSSAAERSPPPRQPQGEAARDSDPGYGWDDYANPVQRGPTTRQPYDREPSDTGAGWNDRRPDAYGDWGAYGNNRSAPVQRPRYRFRDDPSLEGSGSAGLDSGFRFRPLTDKERERHRDSADVGRFPETRREPRYDAGTRSDEAFGYEPDGPSRSFYDRYYGGGR